jgi:hypothetical protein
MGLKLSVLLHELCKVDTYRKEIGRERIDGVWRGTIKFHRDEKFVFGDYGSKSVYLCRKYFPLTDKEATAINCHMGCSEGTGIEALQACKSHPLAWVLHVAYEAATFYLETVP